MEERHRRRLAWIAGATVLLLLLLVAVTTIVPSGSEEAPLAVTPPTITAAGAPSEPGEASSGGFSFGLGDALSLAWRLGLVAAVLGGAVVGLRWWGRRLSSPASQTGSLRITDTLALGSGRTLHLLEAGERVFLIAATPQQINLIAELDRAPATAALTNGGVSEAVPAFARALRVALGARSSRGDGALEVRA
jgi:flagellar biogenesis protein FliO